MSSWTKQLVINAVSFSTACDCTHCIRRLYQTKLARIKFISVAFVCIYYYYYCYCYRHRHRHHHHHHYTRLSTFNAALITVIGLLLLWCSLAGKGPRERLRIYPRIQWVSVLVKPLCMLTSMALDLLLRELLLWILCSAMLYIFDSSLSGWWWCDC